LRGGRAVPSCARKGLEDSSFFLLGSIVADFMSKRRWVKVLFSLWPHWPLDIALILAGLNHVMSVLSHEFGELRNFAAVTSVAQSIALLGIGTRLVLGIGLIFVRSTAP
jgi:L-asparagine transporter-like permease